MTNILFPENYEKAHMGRKRSLTRKFKIEKEWSGLEVAIHSHDIYNYLTALGVKSPNGVVVDLFRYSTDSLGVPYELIDEAFYTQTPIDEETLFLYSQSYNKNAKKLPETDLPHIEITIDFYDVMCKLFKNLPYQFWEKFKKNNVTTSPTSLDSFEVEELFQSFLNEVWTKIKSILNTADEKQVEQAKQMFLAYFYSNDQSKYRVETMELMLEMITDCLKKHNENKFEINMELQGLIKKNSPKEIFMYIEEHISYWMLEKNYSRFLRSISITNNLTLINLLLYLYQKEEATEIKEVHDWSQENRTIKNEANPIFLFGDTDPITDEKTGEVLRTKREVYQNHDCLPLVPYFEKEDTYGKEIQIKDSTTPEKLFEVISLLTRKKIRFESTEMSYFENEEIVLKRNEERINSVQQLIDCWIRSENQEKDVTAKFENDSIISVLTMNLDLPQTPIDFKQIDPIMSLKNNKIKIQRILTNVVVRTSRYLSFINNKINEKEPNKIRRSLEEEIEEAKILQRQALAIVQTDKENKKDKKGDSVPDFADLLSSIHSTSDGEEDES